ncbi:glycosyltransferase [Microbacterium sp. HD4P20]|uniref:glycosyltransferase n=1 Tax=Microbacterium sp. HD4P20 TaxID=2864874 RepID=UPI001C63FB06|nr:glycosyltransferase [Microbacterium sp. HD4P20]MCP2638107.1 glycosyltransferase [Microbacterium sp. HD4P20]
MSGAIVHEWIEQSGGAEKVLDAFVDAYPDADIFALWDDAPGRYPDHDVHETWLARTPLRRHKALALPALPAVWRRLRAKRDYDWMLVSSHLFAHHADFVGTTGVPKLVYAHTPARYIWAPDLDKRGQSSVARAASLVLKPLDRMRAAEAVSIAANSAFVRDRVWQAWGRDARVIHPPVSVKRISSVADWSAELDDGERITLGALGTGFVLGASRFVPYKRLEEVIRVAEYLGIPAVIAGKGPDEPRLRQMASDASVPVTLLQSPSDGMLYALYRAAGVFVFPAIEDFGIMPVEAMSAGCPVVTTNVGGAQESVTQGVSGIIAAGASVVELAAAAAAAIDLPRAKIPSTVERFSVDRFQTEITTWVEETVMLP